MKDNKHIDRVFQEKLKDLDVTPDQSVWNSIESSLNKKKKDRKIIPIWWKLGGVAAALLLLLLVGNLIFNDDVDSSTNPIIVDSEQQDSNTIENKNTQDSQNTSIVDSNNKTEDLENSNQESLSNSNSDKNSRDLNSPEDKSNAIANSTQKSSNTIKQKQSINRSNKKEQIATTDKNRGDVLNTDYLKQTDYENTKGNMLEDKEVMAENKSKENNPTSNNNTGNIIDNANEEIVVEQDEKERIPLTEDLVLNENDTDEKEKEVINRWQINPNIAPVYFNTLGKGSSIDAQLVNNNKNGEVNISYGISVSYAINKRLNIKSGVNKVNLGYSTKDVVVYDHTEMSILTTSSNNDFYKNIKLKGAGTNFSIINGNSYLLRQSPNIANESMTLLFQDMSFYEIPVELQYSIINKKLGLSLIGGFSTLFLSDNKISYESDEQNFVLGEATNINNTSFSANFGLGLDYGISQKVNLNLNPMFKYQLNTFNDTSGDFKPYFIGVYSGISIKF